MRDRRGRPKIPQPVGVGASGGPNVEVSQPGVGGGGYGRRVAQTEGQVGGGSTGAVRSQGRCGGGTAVRAAVVRGRRGEERQGRLSERLGGERFATIVAQNARGHSPYRLSRALPSDDPATKSAGTGWGVRRCVKWGNPRESGGSDKLEPGYSPWWQRQRRKSHHVTAWSR